MPVSTLAMRRPRNAALMRYYAGQATNLHGETIENSQPGSIFSYAAREPVGVVGAITAWNGPLGAVLWKVAPVTGHRLHHGAEAPRRRPR